MSLREEQKRFTRSRLLDAARSAFHDRGFAESTIDEIVERAGASRGTYYLYFKSKTEMLQELMADFNGPADNLAVELSSGHPPTTRAEVADWLERFVDLYDYHRLTIRAWMQAIGHDPRLDTVGEENFKRFVAAISARLAATPGNTDNAATAPIRALLMLTQLERLCYFWFVRGYPVDRRAALDALTDLWCQALGVTRP